MMNLIPMEQCIRGRIYKLRCRNLTVGVYDGEGGFIGIREKLGAKYLFTEYHCGEDARSGTVRSMEDLGVSAPADVPIKESLGTVDETTGRNVHFDGKQWLYDDTDEPAQDVRAFRVGNKELFDLLLKIEDGLPEDK